MANKYIYIVLTRTNTVLSRLIGLIKKDEYTHASISLDRNLTRMFSFGREKAYNPFVGRFVKEDLNEGVFGFQKTLPGLVMEIEVTDKQFENVMNILNEFISNSDLYKYNYIGLINSLLKREAYDDYRFMCSEFVYYIIYICSIADLNISRNLVRPQDLLKLNSTIVYKGNLKTISRTNRILNNIENKKIYQCVEI